MRAKFVNHFLNEELISNIKGIDIFKNPPSVYNFSDGRAIALHNGDVYISESEDIFHGQLLDMLIDENIIEAPYEKDDYEDDFSDEFDDDDDDEDEYDDEDEFIPPDASELLDVMIPFQQLLKTNRLYLAETMGKHQIQEVKKLNHVLSLLKKKNPNIVFVVENINDAWEYLRTHSILEAKEKFGKGISDYYKYKKS